MGKCNLCHRKKCYYFVRQHDWTKYDFLTCYDLETGEWDKPVLIEDCHSRGDFICYKGGLYLFHAPVDREHIGIVKVDTEKLADSRVVLQAHMKTSLLAFWVKLKSYILHE